MSDDDQNPIRDAIQEAIGEHEVILFMKGTPEQPMCGFSARTVGGARGARRAVRGRRHPARPAHPPGAVGDLELADDPAAVRQRRAGRRLRHRHRDVRVRRAGRAARRRAAGRAAGAGRGRAAGRRRCRSRTGSADAARAAGRRAQLLSCARIRPSARAAAARRCACVPTTVTAARAAVDPQLRVAVDAPVARWPSRARDAVVARDAVEAARQPAAATARRRRRRRRRRAAVQQRQRGGPPPALGRRACPEAAARASRPDAARHRARVQRSVRSGPRSEPHAQRDADPLPGRTTCAGRCTSRIVASRRPRSTVRRDVDAASGAARGSAPCRSGRARAPTSSPIDSASGGGVQLVEPAPPADVAVAEAQRRSSARAADAHAQSPLSARACR